MPPHSPPPLPRAGIPKFYRWLSERYPLINQPGGATVAPIIDNFYLDMNGIIHNCKITGHPSGPKTEEEMILQIFTYLEKLVNLIQPQKVLFMAIDGARAQGAAGAWSRAGGICRTCLLQVPRRAGTRFCPGRRRGPPIGGARRRPRRASPGSAHAAAPQASPPAPR